MINQMNHNDTFAPLTSLGAAFAGVTDVADVADVMSRELASIRELASRTLEIAGVNRFLQGNTGNFGISGVPAHAAVRMHAYPVTGASWAICPKTKTSYFQRWKVASLR